MTTQSIYIILMNVMLTDIEVYCYPISQKIRLLESLRQTRPYIFSYQQNYKREKIDHSKILQKISKYSKKMALKMPMYIMPDIVNDKQTIKGKYEIVEELKESTFANLFIVL